MACYLKSGSDRDHSKGAALRLHAYRISLSHPGRHGRDQSEADALSDADLFMVAGAGRRADVRLWHGLDQWLWRPSPGAAEPGHCRLHDVHGRAGAATHVVGQSHRFLALGRRVNTRVDGSAVAIRRDCPARGAQSIPALTGIGTLEP